MQTLQHVLIGLRFDQFNWEVTDGNPEGEGEEEVFPSLFLEFEDEKKKSECLLQIVSKQVLSVCWDHILR